MVKGILEIIQAKRPLGSKRSPKWRRFRDEFVKQNPFCAACGGTTKLEVHHIKPFHLHPELELDYANLIVLCESRRSLSCHFLFGHLLNWTNVNPDVVQDALYWSKKLKKSG